MSPSERNWTIIASFTGCTALIAGAVGAHAVSDAHASRLMDHASLYQLIHASVLLYLAREKDFYARAARALFLMGILLFCGSIYAEALLGWTATLHAAPYGGASLMAAWLLLAFNAYKNTKTKSQSEGD